MRRASFHPRPAAALLAALALAGLAGPARGQDLRPEALGYRAAAEQNRYLVKAKEMVAPAPYMEPRMVHQEQIQATIDRLQGGGYCVAPLVRSCPSCRHDDAREAKCKRPNILVFLVDDMGWGDFQPYGGGVAYGAATPVVQQLAEQGLMLTSTYAQPSCSPTRATIHTGQLPIHHGVLYPPMYGDPGGITEGSLPLPMLLKLAGYTTQGVGKWHMGENLPNLPQNVGYDDYLGFLSVSDMYTEWRDQYYNPEVVRDQERTKYMNENAFSHWMVHATVDPSAEAKALAERQTAASGVNKSPGCEALGEITLPWEAKAENAYDRHNPDDPLEAHGNTNHCYVKPENANQRVSINELDPIWTDYSANFIRKQQGAAKPWFLYHATRGCHFDNYPNPGDHRNSYARTIYSDCTVEMDQVLGKLLTALRETGQDQSTLVFLTSDNGPEEEIPPHGHTPFRGGKGSTWEGGVRVPGIAFWPGMIAPSQISDGLFDLADIYPTALALAGLDLAHPNLDPVLSKDPALVRKIENHYVDGVDQASFLLAPQAASNRRSVLNWYLTNFSAARMDEFKAYVKTTQSIGLSRGYPGGFSGANLPSSYMLMFNLQESPQENDNIAIRHLWAQHLFSAEFQRYFCVLTRYPPHLPTQPMKEIDAMNQINELIAHPEKYRETCQ